MSVPSNHQAQSEYSLLFGFGLFAFFNDCIFIVLCYAVVFILVLNRSSFTCMCCLYPAAAVTSDPFETIRSSLSLIAVKLSGTALPLHHRSLDQLIQILILLVYAFTKKKSFCNGSRWSSPSEFS